jgi:hypothetical protein
MVQCQTVVGILLEKPLVKSNTTLIISLPYGGVSPFITLPSACFNRVFSNSAFGASQAGQGKNKTG